MDPKGSRTKNESASGSAGEVKEPVRFPWFLNPNIPRFGWSIRRLHLCFVRKKPEHEKDGTVLTSAQNRRHSFQVAAVLLPIAPLLQADSFSGEVLAVQDGAPSWRLAQGEDRPTLAPAPQGNWLE